MGAYMGEIMWLCSWPLIIFVSYKFVSLNVRQIERIEKIEDKNL